MRTVEHLHRVISKRDGLGRFADRYGEGPQLG
jgi:hypothetical protein